MERKVVSGMMLPLLLVGILSLAFNIQPAETEPTTWTVDDDGLANFLTIQDAINAANEGDTVQVSAGTYYEHITVNKSIRLIGEDRSNTVIDGGTGDTIVKITAHSVVIGGFTIQNSSVPFSGGIYIHRSHNVTIMGNVIKNNYYGVLLERSNNNTIVDNTIMYSSISGVFLWYSNRSVLRVNVISNGSLDGIKAESYSNFNVLNDNVLMHNEGSGIYLASSNNTVSNNYIHNNAEGIRLLDSSSVINENSLAYNNFSMFLQDSNGSTIYRNNFVSSNVNHTEIYRSSDNTWNNGAEGNYWSDYTGVDSNGDGVGDTFLPHLGVDWHPLMEPWSSLRVFNVLSDGVTHQVKTLSNSTIASFRYVSRQIVFNVTGPPSVTGFCNVTVPKQLLSGSPWLIMLDGINITETALIDENSTHTSLYFTYGFSTHRVQIALGEVSDTIPPVANAGTDQTVDEDTQVIFDASASQDENGIASYTWTFTDGTTQTLSGKNPTYTFDTPSVYTITLNVTDTAGNWATDTIIITVSDVTKPVANAGQDKTVDVGTTVTLDASGSTDNVGIASYEWSFGDGINGTGKTTSHTYTSPGAHIVTLTVKDSAGNSAIHSITVTVLPEEEPPPSPAEDFPIWIAGAVAAAISIATAAIAIFWKKRKHSTRKRPSLFYRSLFLVTI